VTFFVFVPGIPKAQARARARAFKMGDKVRVSMYDPETSRDWKRTVLDRVATAWPCGPPFSGALHVQLDFDLPRPKSLPKRVIHHVRKPDVDNLAKAVKDAMKGIVYRDDSQVVILKVTKMYGETPGVQVTVTGIGRDDGQAD
jgi:Holliday junction resolvase RusA-like endonuclease